MIKEESHSEVFLLASSKAQYFPSPSPHHYEDIISLLFAIDDINKNPDLLPNITVGYQVYDSCMEPSLAIGNILQILSGPGEMVPNYSCGDYGKVVAFIADRSIVTTLPIAQFLTSYGYSQISYGATDPVLNDRTLYPYHFSTGLNDDVQHIAIAELVERLGWTWVVILAPGDDRGERESKNLRNEINKHGACVDFIGTLTEDRITNIRTLTRIQTSTAEVVVLCGGLFHTQSLISLVETMIKDKTLVIPQTWLQLYSYMLFNGSLLFFIENNLCYERSENNSYGLVVKEDILYKDLYFYMLRCVTHDKEKDYLFQQVYGTVFNNCSSYETSVWPHKPNYQVYRAATGLAHAEHLMLSSSGKSHHKDIHKYIHRKQILKSQCSPNCPPGYRKVTRERAPPCCYDCARCSEGEISNLTADMENCLKCPIYKWPNIEKTMCIEKQTEFLSYEGDSLTLVFIVLSVVSILLVTVILGIFISFRDTPLVKANNCNLSFILLFSIKLSFLSVFLFLGRPSDITCILRQTSFGISFSIAMSSVLAKTIMVCIAFKATKPNSSWRNWLKIQLAHRIIVTCSFIQTLITVIWLTLSPPFVELNLLSEPGKIIIQCNEGSVVAFYIVLSYMGLLASGSFIVAFLARTLPDSFNEAKYITFSMLLFCSVWITMIPAYLSTKGKYMVAVEIFAIISSSCGLLFCIFLPKCYIIIFKPKRNTKQFLIIKTDNGPTFNGHTFQQFAGYLGFKHRKITPLLPKANGIVEIFMISLAPRMIMNISTVPPRV
ncbi:vomeronasal type-2 receptor 116 [Xenopus laevis]|uniref:Vomeronasal type-2 receptor 116 n=1 Tax=Xenopus laevis TaxID=8355 RepID=A0A8J0U624_XENLA|nr:vomeronasal type-2 receptor 116 [Xenopus laevis]